MIQVVFITAPQNKAEFLARKILEERLVACVNLVPKVKSLYWWQGKLESSAETLMILKTPKRNLKRLIKRVEELHPYDVPEVLALPVEAGHRPYLDWVRKEANANT